ncbi:hypothetical protein Godav_010850 [Gossypium davidsonii]|uniref:F-box associated domain-containing protein n=1 Tax=Gossypium davidsonii TaxID=34287 RepID=A0A7J8R893_GOSDV|nr:hypothetical protein [Gossypium davidsonii]
MVQSHGNNDEYFHSEAKVYSLRTNCWRRIKDVCFYHKFSREFGFLANNALHWMVFKTPQSRNQELVGFDLGSEEFPTYREINNVVVDVWIMKEYGVKQSWIKSISWNEPHNISDSPVAAPLAFSKNGNKVLFNIAYKWCHLRKRGGKFVWYDLGSQRVENVGNRQIPTSFDVDLFVDSLVPLNSNAQQ